MTTLREQVRENLGNALDNSGGEILHRPAKEVAFEMLEYTTLDDENGKIIELEDDNDYVKYAELITPYVKEWQDEQSFS